MSDFFDGIEAVIFDMDGTLLDTMRYWRYTTLEYLLAHQLPVAQEDLLRMFDTSSRALIPEIAARLGVQIAPRAELIEELAGFMNRHYLYDACFKDADVPAFLQALVRRGVRLCVATGSPAAYARNGLERLGIADYFEFIADNYDAQTDKAHPAAFRVLAGRLGTTPKHCVVVEDALYSIRSAKEAGCRILAVEDDTARLQRSEIIALADAYIRTYREALALL